MICMSGSVDRDIPLRLGPGSGIGTMRVNNSADLFPMLVQNGMGFCITGWAQTAINRCTFKINNDYFIWCKLAIWYAAGLDSEDPFISVGNTYISKSE